ncbi:MAG TPA: hypothetical protein VKF14_20565 [Candidatus Dormibacteraeota bacterium]|nr:hypothetical protein [Candidatus Dormibacteraeota bacterium]
MNLKRHVRWGFALTTGVVLAAAGAAPAVASSVAAAPGQSPSPGAHAAYCQDFVAHLAQSLGVNQTRLQVALTRAASQTVDDAVARGDITSDQANTMKSRLTAGICGAHMGGFDISGAVSQNVVAAAATALGTTPEHLRSQLDQGKSVSQIAPAGMTEQQFATKMESAMKTQLDAKVKAGTMTQSQENQVLQRVPAVASHLWTQGAKAPSPGATAPSSPAP